MKIYTKGKLIEALLKIRAKGWVETTRPGNDGGVGNTLEHLLGISENNLTIPNASEWELKAQRLNSSALGTLFHQEPSPRNAKIVPQILLPFYGWKHKEAGGSYPTTEKSFRQTIRANSSTDRGFSCYADSQERKIVVSFDSSSVAERHSEWLESVNRHMGLGQINPQPYWGFDDIFHACGVKLTNTFLVQAEVKREGGKEFFHYTNIKMLRNFSIDKLILAFDRGIIFVDFDARTGHNWACFEKTDSKIESFG